MNAKLILWKHQKRKSGKYTIKIYISQIRDYINTPFAVFPEEWDDIKEIVKRNHPLSQQINKKLSELKFEALKSLLDGNNPKNKPDSNNGSFIDYLTNYISDARKGKYNLTSGTIKNYSSTLTRLNEYLIEKKLNNLSFDDIDYKFESMFVDFLLKIGNEEAGISKHFKIIRRILKVSFDTKLHSNDIFKSEIFRKKEPVSNHIYLNKYEIQKIIDLTNLQEHLEIERIRFLVAYFLLLRYSDSVKIKKEAFFIDNDSYFFTTSTVKTKKTIYVPVSPLCYELLKKLDFQFNNDTNQECNRKLKIIAKLAGINQDVEINQVTYKKYELVTTHTARRSAATNLAIDGVSLKIIADLGGWSSLKMLQTYLKISGFESAKIAANLPFFN